MNYLKEFSYHNIEVNWGTLFIGTQGLKKIPPLISIREVIEWALEKYLKENDKNAYQIAFLNITSFSEINEKLILFSRNYKLSKEEKKWCYLLLINFLKNLSKSYVQGLIQLSEFWDSFDYPSYMPHQIQGQNNNLSPEQYYTDQNYHFLLDAHQKWLNNLYKEIR